MAKIFETTNVGAHPTGTAFSCMKIKKSQSLSKKILSKKIKNQKNFMLNRLIITKLKKNFSGIFLSKIKIGL